mmetsp:Transcript_64794/g.164197  ORF Transcript_64794/g.164197 Transcript_64794/m.164197 type:complete len:585 (+) Transcript_64794:270-2024(+)
MLRTFSTAHVRSAEEAAVLHALLRGVLLADEAHELLGVHLGTRTAEGRIWVLHVEADALPGRLRAAEALLQRLDVLVLGLETAAKVALLLETVDFGGHDNLPDRGQGIAPLDLVLPTLGLPTIQKRSDAASTSARQGGDHTVDARAAHGLHVQLVGAMRGGQLQVVDGLAEAVDGAQDVDRTNHLRVLVKLALADQRHLARLAVLRVGGGIDRQPGLRQPPAYGGRVDDALRHRRAHAAAEDKASGLRSSILHVVQAPLDVAAGAGGIPEVRRRHAHRRRILRRTGRRGQRRGARELRERGDDACNATRAQGVIIRQEGGCAIVRCQRQGGRNGGDGVHDAGQIHYADLSRSLQEIRAHSASLGGVSNVRGQGSDLHCGLLDVEDTLGNGRLLALGLRKALESSAMGLEVRLQVHALLMQPAQGAVESLLHDFFGLFRILGVHRRLDCALRLLEPRLALLGPGRLCAAGGAEDPILDETGVLIRHQARHLRRFGTVHQREGHQRITPDQGQRRRRARRRCLLHGQCGDGTKCQHRGDQWPTPTARPRRGAELFDDQRPLLLHGGSLVLARHRTRHCSRRHTCKT